MFLKDMQGILNSISTCTKSKNIKILGYVAPLCQPLFAPLSSLVILLIIMLAFINSLIIFCALNFEMTSNW